MNWKSWTGLLSFAYLIAQGVCQLAENTPPYMWMERNWQIPDNEIVGSRIALVHAKDNENDPLTFGLEPKVMNYESDEPPPPLPFWIDPVSGAVYLNESLKDKGGTNIFLYVTLTDGYHHVKNEVYVNILNSSAPTNNKRPFNVPPFPGGPGSFNPFAGFNQRPVLPPPNTPPRPHSNPPTTNLDVLYNPSANIANNPAHPIVPNNKPYFVPKKPKNQTLQVTPLRPVGKETSAESPSNSLEEKNGFEEERDNKQKTEKDIEVSTNENELLATDQHFKQPELASTVVSIISVCAVFFTVGVIALIFRKKLYFKKKKHKSDEIRKDPNGITLREEGSINMHEWRGPRAFSNRYEPWRGEGASAPSEINSGEDGLKKHDSWEFPRHRLKFFNILGEGAFGQVWKCEAMDLEGKDAGPTIVAVKTLKENANEKEKSDLVSELGVMKMLEPHPNVVKLLGCCTEKAPIFLIMEYITNGKLQSYLRNSRAERYYNNMHGKSKTLTSRDLTSFCHQVAKGMEFLSANGIIHRDLAARNILITEDHNCKVADFGFARDVISSHVYERKSEGRLPIRWMAPESLYDNIFSVKSDVWSFGVLIWEIVTLGSTPYPGLSAAEVMRKVRDGYRLDKPEHCRREIYNIMFYCWDKDPSQRPTFTELVTLLEKLIMTETDYIELERFPDHSYYNMMGLSGEKL
ncbi:tyrosine kinase receptor Cad96Ca [Anthonomus grandis grandis]|uniref:tyrosine kinase receptor Cad96Ca n=1 Tax=Anthonomus grandis grandis TaxID=2921223 RepID=UPI002165DE72|nr:tyrosine kinase receptor Cad96Ca [Anthonomus grandis grandis]